MKLNNIELLPQIISGADFVAQDGLLCFFFFVIGLELVEEIRNGDLRDVRHASLPALAALGGVVVPAGLYIATISLFHLSSGESFSNYLGGWAIPSATDIAFSLAVLSIFHSRLKNGLKLFLMVLAVVDDIIGIVIIAIAYSHDINPLIMLLVVAILFIWCIAVRQSKICLPLVIILGVSAWISMCFTGIHPTIAGVLLGITVPARKFDFDEDHRNVRASRAHYWAEKFAPFSNKVVVPIFASVSILASIYELWHGFSQSGGSEHYSLTAVVGVPAAIVVALVVGKPLGIMLFAAIGQHLTPLQLFHGLRVRNLLPVAILGGIGFTVSFLVASLSFEDVTIVALARVGVVIGSVISALGGYLVMRLMLRSTPKRGTGNG